jgi:hypothetical protein
LAKSGVNLDGVVQFNEVLATNPDLKKDAETYFNLVSEVIQNIFEGMDISPIMNAIKQGDVNGTKQEYAKTNFNYYMKQKKDEGVLYISLVKDPVMTVFFKDADELAASGLRLHAGTTYITSVADVRLPYPQIEIVNTSGSAGGSAGGSVAPTLSANDLDAETDRPRLKGPGARAAKTQAEPKTDAATLGRERRK